ncbi:hypothetical protein GCM10010968_25000 [Agrococcus terreus]|uniref:Uncharacterized protein n=1 Tax=Agrococcus terreus TaxID=574649 RepID=A0ABQ2KNX4_9MICO|nr:hypothetical protein GCM10010968_25000 [Agrococcus terreus]
MAALRQERRDDGVLARAAAEYQDPHHDILRRERIPPTGAIHASSATTPDAGVGGAA